MPTCLILGDKSLHRDLVQHGAAFLQYLDSKTMATHIITSTLPPKKTVEYNRYRIVKPAWVTDSIKAGKLLPWTDYRVISDGPRQKVISFEGGKMQSQASSSGLSSYREQTENSFYTSQLLNSAPDSETQASNENGQGLVPLAATGTSADDGKDIPIEAMSMPQSPPTEAKDLYIGDDLIEDGDFFQHDHDGEVSDEAAPQVDETDEDLDKKHATAPPKNITPEEHNAWLLSDPRIRKSSSANPDFLKQFYSESRLHHLSTWKAELKSRMQRLAAERGRVHKPVKRKPGSRRYVMHVDFDSFFCAVSLKKHPEYADKPTVVAHGTGNGSEIASCNYPAREFGVTNGMWMKRALELCPHLKVLPYDFPAYEEASRLFYESILDIGGIVQSVSVDEALVDITAIVLANVGSDGTTSSDDVTQREQANVDQLAQTLRESVKDQTGCNVSVGIGSNILQAKVALRKAKPAGQYQLRHDEILDVIGELKVENLPGVARSIGGKLQESGMQLVKDLRQLPKERLSSILGPKTGEKLWEYARGIDRLEVGEQPPRKSVSAEVSWGIRFINQEEADEFLRNLCKELERRLLNEQVKGKHLTLKIMRRCLDSPLDAVKHLGHGKCDSFNKSTVFGVATNNAEMIGREAVSILRSFKFSPGDLRGLGVQMTKLDPIKTSGSGIEGSQKKLAFPGAVAPGSARKMKLEPIEETNSPVKGKHVPQKGLSRDPIIDDPMTPPKAKPSTVHSAFGIARAGEADSKAITPLNVAGTQFIMPTNPDPAVLAELPNDIRTKLLAQAKVSSRPREILPMPESGYQSPAELDEIPSQVDPDVFMALPEDMKAEILESYGRKKGQTRLPQSPRKDHVLQTKKSISPAKRSARGMFGKAKERQHDAEAKRQQTSFLPAKPARDSNNAEEPDELDPEFLAELPEDVRREVIDDHRRRKLAQRSGLNLNIPARRAAPQSENEDALPSGQLKIEFPVLPPKIKFPGSSVDSLQGTKDMLDSWHSETRDDGPHDDDVDVFAAHIGRIIQEEKDLDKAVKLIRWLEWIIEYDGPDGQGKDGWRIALQILKGQAQESSRLRGLAPISF
jgi:DNA repair protein REV1